MRKVLTLTALSLLCFAALGLFAAVTMPADPAQPAYTFEHYEDGSGTFEYSQLISLEYCLPTGSCWDK